MLSYLYPFTLEDSFYIAILSLYYVMRYSPYLGHKTKIILISSIFAIGAFLGYKCYVKRFGRKNQEEIIPIPKGPKIQELFDEDLPLDDSRSSEAFTSDSVPREEPEPKEVKEPEAVIIEFLASTKNPEAPKTPEVPETPEAPEVPEKEQKARRKKITRVSK